MEFIRGHSISMYHCARNPPFMKNRICVFFVAATALVLVQCKSKKEAAKPAEVATRKEVEKGDPSKTLDIDNSYVWPGSTDPFRILSAEVTTADSLVLEVEYGGGCKEHVFKLITNGMLKKSMPPQCTLYIEHESNDDMCRAMLRQKLSFYIGNLAKNGETIVVQLNGFDSVSPQFMLNPQKK